MRYLPTGAQMKQGDQKTITEMGMPSMVLMERAALSVVEMMESVYFGRYIYIWMELYDAGDKEDLKQIVSMMKTVYQKYASKSYIRKAHKISYRMIFRMPALYRKLANAVIS